MNRSYLRLLLGLVALLALGCTSAEDRLVGTWVTPEQEKTDEQPARSQGQGLAGLVANLVEGARSSVRTEIIFRADGTGRRADSALGFSQVDDGYWKVVDEKDNTATVHVSASQDFSSPQVWDITFLESGRLRVVLPDRTVELERQPKS